MYKYKYACLLFQQVTNFKLTGQAASVGRAVVHHCVQACVHKRVCACLCMCVRVYRQYIHLCVRVCKQAPKNQQNRPYAFEAQEGKAPREGTTFAKVCTPLQYDSCMLDENIEAVVAALAL